jgi:ABC-type branched-subunit amino acid transport system ATPase component
MNALSGLNRVAAGTISVGGVELRNAARGVDPHGLASLGIARTFQTPLIVPELDAIENVMVGLHSQMRAGIVTGALKPGFVRREERAARVLAVDALERVGFGADLRTPVKNLPFGEIRRLEIARALAPSPRLILLDEPTSGLEMDAAVAILSQIQRLQADREGGLTVVIVEHNVPLLFSHCDTVTAMVQGRDVVTATPDVVRDNAEVRASYLGEQIAVEEQVEIVGATSVEGRDA